MRKIKEFFKKPFAAPLFKFRNKKPLAEPPGMQSFILPVRSESSAKLTGHTSGPGTRYVFSDKQNNPQGGLYAILRTVENVQTPEPHVELHKHNVDSLWIFRGANADLTGLKVEVVLGKESFILDTPASVYIPAEVCHTYRFVSGSGDYINIVLVKGGDYNTAVQVGEGK